MGPEFVCEKARIILAGLAKYPMGMFNLEENVFLIRRCRRLAGIGLVPVKEFDEADLQELKRIARRVKWASRVPFKLLKFERKEPDKDPV